EYPSSRVIIGELSGDMGKIHRKIGSIVVPGTQKSGGLPELVASIKGIAAEHRGTVFIACPEGRTSGWANNGGPYDLDAFRSGLFVVGCETGLPILPVGMYFDPDAAWIIRCCPQCVLAERMCHMPV